MSALRVLAGLAALAVAVDIGSGIVYDAHVTSGQAVSCVALPQHPSGARLTTCEHAAVDVWTHGLPYLSQSILHLALHVWQNAKMGRNTVQ